MAVSHLTTITSLSETTIAPQRYRVKSQRETTRQTGSPSGRLLG